jgi:hypothetical protein
MNKAILYTAAVDKNGNLIHIDNAEKGINYYCPMCKKEFILRKSGKTGKGSRRSHFAHDELTQNCTPEGVLHYSFKKMLVDLLEKYKTENKSFIFNWVCTSCNNNNSGNLLEKATLIKEEYALGECRPDIALLDKEENVLAVIELVDAHKPEESVLQYYREREITLIQINLTSEEDLMSVEEKIKNPDIVDLCLNPKCPNRERYKISRNALYFPIQCGRGFHKVQGFMIGIECIFGRQTSRNFTEDEINKVTLWAAANNIEITVGSNEAKEKYPQSICSNCKIMLSKYRRFRL